MKSLHDCYSIFQNVIIRNLYYKLEILLPESQLKTINTNFFNWTINFANLNEIKIDNVEFLNSANLLISNISGNIGHFYNDHLYGFLTCYYHFSDITSNELARIICPPLEPCCEKNQLWFFNNCIHKKHIAKKYHLIPNKFYKVETLIIPHQDRTMNFRINGETLCKTVRQMLWDNTKFNQEETNDKILIYFDGTQGRSILNIEQLVSRLKNNYTIQVKRKEWFEKTSPEEIWKTYFNCNIYIAPWGAHLLQCLICKPKTKIIVLKSNADRNKINEPWYEPWHWEYPGYMGWSNEYIHNKELNNYYYVVECPYAPWVGNSGSAKKCKDLNINYTDFRKCIEISANLIPNIDYIVDLIEQKIK